MLFRLRQQGNTLKRCVVKCPKMNSSVFWEILPRSLLRDSYCLGGKPRFYLKGLRLSQGRDWHEPLASNAHGLRKHGTTKKQKGPSNPFHDSHWFGQRTNANQQEVIGRTLNRSRRRVITSTARATIPTHIHIRRSLFFVKNAQRNMHRPSQVNQFES